MNYATLKAAGYILVNTPDMIEHNGTTQTTEKIVNPDSEYLKHLYDNVRSFEDVVNYAPNQTYIGNLSPQELKEIKQPWYENKYDGTRDGLLGEIMPELEFYGLLQLCDVFELVYLEKSFALEVKEALEKHDLFKDDASKIILDSEASFISDKVNNDHAEGLYYNRKLVGCVLKAHDIDVNLNAHVMLENLVVKASGVLALRNMIVKNNINASDIDFVIECSEEACGDMNQRGGGNFAKSIAELAGCSNATGCDVRGFCAGPTHALILAASMVAAGTHDNVVVVAGGATAKLGMNGKSHYEKGLPLLEDVIGGFAIMISKNDGISPVIRTDYTGKHTVSSGSSPQAVTTALIASVLDKANISVHDIDYYSVEMQNPDITKPAGAGDVPEANLKMIGAIGVLRKELEKKDLAMFVKDKLIPGWAPTQGHIPSGVPYLGFAIRDLTEGTANKVMVVGKGSLFLGRMTNLFDGVSVIIERNNGEVAGDFDKVMLKDEVKKIMAEQFREFSKVVKE
jgi:hypothetical protein